jgi:hypothetical protein
MKQVMGSKEIREFKHNFKKKYTLPYKSKSGIRFSNNGVSMVTQYGIVFSDNGYLGDGKYYPILRHTETDGDGSIKYNTSVKVGGLGNNSDLDKLGAAILSNLKKNIANKIEVLENL